MTNYVEPFFGSGAVLLGRPHRGHTETINDADAYVANFWRALKNDFAGVAEHVTWPVSEVDILARHKWLLSTGAERLNAIREHPDAYDSKVAGWWCWGLACWIGAGWCQKYADQLPHLGNAGRGVTKKLPHLGDAGNGVTKKLPHLGNAGRGVMQPSVGLTEWLSELSERLRTVRVACGDWSRVTGESVTFKHGLTGVFLDPPYGDDQHCVDYGAKCDSREVVAWAIENGCNPLLRIAMCGYEGEHTFPESWSALAWKAVGGFGSQSSVGRGRDNAGRERIWFSPHCLNASLFDYAGVS